MAEPRADWAIELKKFFEVKIAELFETLAELRGEWKKLDADLSDQIKEVRADVKDLGKDARSSNGTRKLEIGLLFALLGTVFLTGGYSKVVISPELAIANAEIEHLKSGLAQTDSAVSDVRDVVNDLEKKAVALSGVPSQLDEVAKSVAAKDDLPLEMKRLADAVDAYKADASKLRSELESVTQNLNELAEESKSGTEKLRSLIASGTAKPKKNWTIRLVLNKNNLDRNAQTNPEESVDSDGGPAMIFAVAVGTPILASEKNLQLRIGLIEWQGELPLTGALALTAAPAGEHSLRLALRVANAKDHQLLLSYLLQGGKNLFVNCECEVSQ